MDAEAVARAGAVFDALSGVFMRAGGTSGPLYGIWFRELASAAGEDRDALSALAAGAQAGVAAVQRLGGAQEGDKTMVDAMLPGARALQRAAAEQRELSSALRRGGACCACRRRGHSRDARAPRPGQLCRRTGPGSARSRRGHDCSSVRDLRRSCMISYRMLEEVITPDAVTGSVDVAAPLYCNGAFAPATGASDRRNQSVDRANDLLRWRAQPSRRSTRCCAPPMRLSAGGHAPRRCIVGHICVRSPIFSRSAASALRRCS